MYSIELTDMVKIDKFAEYLKQKVDKSLPFEQAVKLVKRMDINKDSFVCAQDLKTSIQNKAIEKFFTAQR